MTLPSSPRLSRTLPNVARLCQTQTRFPFMLLQVFGFSGTPQLKCSFSLSKVVTRWFQVPNLPPVSQVLPDSCTALAQLSPSSPPALSQLFPSSCPRCCARVARVVRKLSQTLPDSPRFSQILPDSPRLSQILRFSQMLPDSPR